MDGFIGGRMEAVLSGEGISAADAARLIDVPDDLLDDLCRCAGQITGAFCGDDVDVEQLHNIKRDACSEDCTFCAQSALYDTGTTFNLPAIPEVVEGARRAKEAGSQSYCLVAAWREPPPDGFEQVCRMVSLIRRDVGIEVECSLGFLTPERASRLRGLGVRRYNHNLETARSKFAEICTTHTYDDRLRTLRIAREAGLELCTGGIIGLGEERGQRLELLLDVARLDPEEVTINMLVPVPGTPLELQPVLGEREILRVFAVARFLMPGSVIKASGGREASLPDGGAALLRSGASGLITGGYLTRGGNSPREDAEVIRRARAAGA